MRAKEPERQGSPRTLCTLAVLGVLELGLIAYALSDTAAAPAVGKLKPTALCDSSAAGVRVYPGASEARLALATAYDRLYTPLAAISVSNKRAYARRHGLPLFVFGPGALACDRPASWSKVLAVRAALRAGHEWVAWLDSDAVFARLDGALDDAAARPHVAAAMRGSTAKLVIATDSRGVAGARQINNGVFLLRRSAWAERFLAAVWNSTAFLADTPGVRNSRLGDQRAFEAAIERLGGGEGGAAADGLGGAVAYVPQGELNSYPRTYQPGELVVHIAGCLAGARRTLSSCAAELARWAAVEVGEPEGAASAHVAGVL